MGGTRPLVERYRQFADASAAAGSALTARIAHATADTPEVIGALQTAVPARRRHPALVLAALRDIALSGRAPALAAAYSARDAEAAARAALAVLLGQLDAVLAVVERRRVPAVAESLGAILYPAAAEAADRAGASAIGLIDVGCGAGLDLALDRVGIKYDSGQVLGDPSSPVQLAASLVGHSRVPSRGLPEVVARIGIDSEPLNVSDADDARWLRACVDPEAIERAARLSAEIDQLAADPPLLVSGDVIDMLPEAVGRVPDGALPIVITTWALSRLAPQKRLRFLQCLDAAATDRTVAWVSVEGVGVAPAVPTFGDRHASGHSIVGLATFDRSVLQTEAVGRCWSQGRLMSWLASD